MGSQASCVVGAELFALGTSLSGTVLRSVRLADGARRLDLARRGRDAVGASERLLLLDSMQEPGVQVLTLDGEAERTLEETATQELVTDGGRVLCAVRTGEAPHRMARLRDQVVASYALAAAGGLFYFGESGQLACVDAGCEAA